MVFQFNSNNFIIIIMVIVCDYRYCSRDVGGRSTVTTVVNWVIFDKRRSKAKRPNILVATNCLSNDLQYCQFNFV